MKWELTAEQTRWVEQHLNEMSLEERIGHLLCPSWDMLKPEEWKAILPEIPVGSMFFADWRTEDLEIGTDMVFRLLRIQPLIAADMESGYKARTSFPTAMACGATNHPEWMADRGRATAREARAAGICWSFAPNIDIPMNHRNLETLTRAWSDDPDTIIRMTTPLIKAMQEHDLAATCKHFPGTGVDDRDQHMCTAINPLPMDQWMATFGKVWKSAIDQGVMSIMPGHIALPDYEGKADHPWECLPATLNKHLLTDLLRRDLGFEGVIVSDAGTMIGFASRVPRERMALDFILAGGDVYLFPEVREDFGYLMAAHRRGELTLERINQSVKRVLTMKALLKVSEMPKSAPVPVEELQQSKELATRIAEQSITIQRSSPAFPAKLKPGSRVLTVTIAPDFGRETHRTLPMDTIDEELRARGFEVTNMKSPGHEVLRKAIFEYDHIFMNFQTAMHQVFGNARIIDQHAMNFWEAFWYGHDHIVFTSFGSPYHLYELPHLPNMILAYAATTEAQRAAVKVWLGEMVALGKSPITMPKEAGPCL